MADEIGLAIPGAESLLQGRLFVPRGAQPPSPLLLFFPGGGWDKGGIETHASTCRMLAHHGGCRVLAAEYRLAPEHPFPAAIDDAVAVLRWVGAHLQRLGGKEGRLSVAGDSAGGNLAAAVALMTQGDGLPPVRSQLLIYPALDLLEGGPSRRAFARGYWLDTLDDLIAGYTPDPEMRCDPRASPLRARDLHGLPPATIVTAGYDPLRDEARAYARRLLAAGVRCELLEHPAMIHGFFALHGIFDEAREALAETARQMARRL